MRKRYHKKARSCPMCKPYKMNGAKRWNVKEESLLKEFEKEKQNSEKNVVDSF